MEIKLIALYSQPSISLMEKKVPYSPEKQF